MSLSLDELLDDVGPAVALVAGRDGGDTRGPIRRAHRSDTPDPWLEGGGIVLTGLGVEDAPDVQRRPVRDLRDPFTGTAPTRTPATEPSAVSVAAVVGPPSHVAGGRCSTWSRTDVPPSVHGTPRSGAGSSDGGGRDDVRGTGCSRALERSTDREEHVPSTEERSEEPPLVADRAVPGELVSIPDQVLVEAEKRMYA